MNVHKSNQLNFFKNGCCCIAEHRNRFCWCSSSMCMHQMCIFPVIVPGTMYVGEKGTYFGLFQMLRRRYKKIRANMLQSCQYSWTDIFNLLYSCINIFIDVKSLNLTLDQIKVYYAQLP